MSETTTPKQPNASGVALHRLVQPFVRTETARWREREVIRNAIEELYHSLAEASQFLDMDERLQDRLHLANQAIRDAEDAVKILWPTVVHPCVGTHGTIAHLVNLQDDGTMKCRRCGAVIGVKGLNTTISKTHEI